MRLIGHVVNETSARTFGDYLYIQGIDHRIEFQQEEGWGIWVNDEDKLEDATSLLEEFRADPANPKYQAQARKAAGLREEQKKGEEAYRKRLRSRRHLFRPLRGYGFGPLTFGLICISVFVFFQSNLGREQQRVMALFITNFSLSGGVIVFDPTLPEIRHGQIWRLITPIFIHGGWLHILFNMLWLRDLGSMIEGRQSTMQLGLLVLVSAAGSNLAQFYFGHLFDLRNLRELDHLLSPHPNPVFGGMSGVVYALFGYIWLRGKFDPGSGLFLHSSTVIMMLVWLVLCFTGFIPIANTAHVAGLLIGMGWGCLSSLKYRRS